MSSGCYDGSAEREMCCGVCVAVLGVCAVVLRPVLWSVPLLVTRTSAKPGTVAAPAPLPGVSHVSVVLVRKCAGAEYVKSPWNWQVTN